MASCVSLRWVSNLTQVGNLTQIGPTLAPSDWKLFGEAAADTILNSERLAFFIFARTLFCLTGQCGRQNCLIKKCQGSFVTAPPKIQILLMITFTKVFVVLTAVSHVETVGVAVAGELILLQLHRVALQKDKCQFQFFSNVLRFFSTVLRFFSTMLGFSPVCWDFSPLC